MSKKHLNISKLLSKKLEQNMSGFTRIQTFKEPMAKNNTFAQINESDHKPSYLTNISESKELHFGWVYVYFKSFSLFILIF